MEIFKMPTSVRLCEKILSERRKAPYALIADLIGKEHSGQGNLAIDHEKILREAFRRKK